MSKEAGARADLKDEEFGDAFGEPALGALQDHLEHVSTQFLHHHEYLRAGTRAGCSTFRAHDSHCKNSRVRASQTIGHGRVHKILVYSIKITLY